VNTRNGQVASAANAAQGGNGEGTDSIVVGRSAQGIEIHAALVHLTRFSAVFEIYEPTLILRSSEVISDFKIVLRDSVVYQGRAVVSHLASTSTSLICEASLEDSWLDVQPFPPRGGEEQLREDFARFIAASQRTFKILPEFKVAVADLQILLMDLRLWLEQVELGIRSQPVGDRDEIERNTILAIQEPLVGMALQVLEHFELSAQKVEFHTRAAHMNYMKRQIHPLVLCSPFIHRTFYKPLGYAGDYEMVNMMVRDPYEGGSMFAKILNRIFLSTPPVEAHRNRLVYLTGLLRDEALRVWRRRGVPRILNMGCGPAKELQDFLTQLQIEREVEFTLIDFNEETLRYTSRVLGDINRGRHCPARLNFVKKSVHQFIKEAARSRHDPARYDVIYCAGLFDYLPDSVSKKILNIFHDLLAPGGLLAATNVSDANPSRHWMEYVLDWHLIYRGAQRLASLAPDAAPPDRVTIRSVGTGVNIFLEVRKPEDAQ
jgi:extracellular factor (EF) 3-hydroxypalmitic acid methyl ester biosynthesis protein